MARLVVNPGSSAAWEIQLKQGPNFLGRGFANDFKIDDPSVSGAHCQILVDQTSVLIKDLGSTNGTFVDRKPVSEAQLLPGQTIHLGGVELLLEPDGGASTGAPPPLEEPALAAEESVPRVRQAVPLPPRLAASPPPISSAPVVIGSQNCKFHPKTPGRYFCNKCTRFFCELCVTTRGPKKLCRHCGVECTPVQVQTQRLQTKGFFARLPGAFIYPFKGSGVLILLVATLLFAGLDAISGGIAIFATMAALGYLFSYMQNIIHSTASEEEEMASLPDFDGLFGAFLTLAGTVLLCFTVPIGLAVAKIFFEVEIPTSAIVVTMFVCCFYFPMAFLAVAMKDSAFAANPMIVFPAIFKVPLEYLLTAIILTGVFGTRMLGNVLMSGAKMAGYHTKDMSVLFLTFGLRAVWALLSVYLLTVGMRILGLLYVTKKQKFGWFAH